MAYLKRYLKWWKKKFRSFVARTRSEIVIIFQKRDAIFINDRHALGHKLAS